MFDGLVMRGKFKDPIDDQRAVTIASLSLFLGITGSIYFLTAWSLGTLSATTAFIQLFMLIVLYGLTYWLVRIRRLQWAATLLTLTTAGITVSLSLISGAELNLSVILGYSMTLLLSAYLVGNVWTLLLTVLIVTAIGYNQYQLLLTQGAKLLSPFEIVVNSPIAVTGIAVFIFAGIALIVTGGLRQLAVQAQRRARQLEIAALISETAGQTTAINALLNLAVERIRETFGFYHAQVFLLDQTYTPGSSQVALARLEASTGRAGVALLARGHSLPVGSRSVIGRTTFEGKPVVVNDTRTDPTHRPNELLPNTRAELAVPLMVTGIVIGALDVQSIEANAFSPDDVLALSFIANQLASNIEKTRLVTDLQTRADENKFLYEETQRNLRQIEELNRRLTREGWTEYLRSHRSRGELGYTLQSGASIQPENNWTAPMRQAYQGESSVIIRQDQQAHIAAIPIRVRGEVIGVLEVERGGEKPWTDHDIELAETLVDRLALAIENARLFEQASMAAERESVVNRIAQDVQQAESIDAVLRSALSELSTVLGASRGVVQIAPKAVEPVIDSNE
jgi:GAF domain-containing protein